MPALAAGQLLGPILMFPESEKRYPSRSRQTSLATAVVNITKPVTKNNFVPSSDINRVTDCKFLWLILRHKTTHCIIALHQLPLMKQKGATWSAVKFCQTGAGQFPGTMFEFGLFG